MRVLLVEDDLILGEAVRDHVTKLGHAVDWTTRLEDAKASVAAVDYAMILLDLRLPDGSGNMFLKDIRASGNVAPVIILTAHDQISDRIEGLNNGADDYLVKPFDLGELSARFQAVARRYSGHPHSVVQVGKLEIIATERRVKRAGVEISLSSREWAILDALAMRPMAVVSKARLEEELYAFGQEIESNTVEVFVSRLRKKLGFDSVTTIRGIGYRLEG